MSNDTAHSAGHSAGHSTAHDIDLTTLSPTLVEHYRARARIARAQAIVDLVIACSRSCTGLLNRLRAARPVETGHLSTPKVARRVGLAGR